MEVSVSVDKQSVYEKYRKKLLTSQGLEIGTGVLQFARLEIETPTFILTKVFIKIETVSKIRISKCMEFSLNEELKYEKVLM